MAMFWIILTIYIFYIFLEFFLTMFDKSVKVWMRESVWKCKRTVKLTLAQNMPTFAPKARRSAFIRTRTAHARPSSLKKIFTFSSVLFNLFLWLNLILTSGAVLHLHLGWFYIYMRKISSANNKVMVHNTSVIHGNPMPSNHMLCIQPYNAGLWW